ncbi:MAG: thiol-disulfide oxidoreductase [Acidobacteria bacterium]|jgi:predicted DCC family thiol-disulfide oxidoreductase YuxK|nr:MAG: thiol-disulfide oxidoreductase [Acidobacteriota bacterium]
MLPPIILYDGVCGLCNRLNQFVLRRDREGIVRFASLQSPLAARILARHGVNPQDLDSVYVVLNHDLTKEAQPDERLLPRSDAVIFALKRLGGIWKVLGLFVQLLPRFLRDWGYRVVARNRYRVFGRFETCMLPSARDRSKFIDC